MKEATNNKLTTVTFRLTQEEKDLLVAYCQANDMSLSQFARKAVKEYMNKEEIM